MSLHPTQTTKHLHDVYVHYLKTIKPFQDDRLRMEFAHALKEENLLLKGPFIEITPPFKPGKSLRELVEEGLLSRQFEKLCHKTGLPWERQLYKHQESAIRKMATGRNVIVTTGTGSGKTEAFLIPILNHLLREVESGTLSQPGVRALILYPMNALANDQMERLRVILKQYPAITFGRYIGETKNKEKEAREEFQKLHLGEPLPNELVSREQMQLTPPHLLLTNYAMLEYLLLRPNDSPLFDGETGRCWHFIALDEAHVYDGAQATEIAMLLRRLQDRVTDGGKKQLQAILTSATLGEDNAESIAQTVKYANELFNLPFQWVDGDPSRQDIVRGERIPESDLPDPWGACQIGTYEILAKLADQWRDGVGYSREGIEELPGIPAEILEQAIAAAQADSTQATPLFLFHVLSGDGNLRALRSLLRDGPALMEDTARKVFPKIDPAEAQEVLAHLVSTAILARESTEHASLLPARYHIFLRALEGAFICLNTHAPEHQGENAKPLFFLKRHKICPHCSSRVFELANCTRCGAAYIIGNETSGSDMNDDDFAFTIEPNRDYLTQNSVLYPNEIEAKNIKYFSLDDSLSDADEDALIEGEAEAGEKLDDELHPMELCPRCGVLSERDVAGSQCKCGKPRMKISKVDIGKRTTLRRCTSCSTYTKGGVIYRFLTGQDAPVSVLAGSLYEEVPPARNEEERLFPGEGRKMLIFTDNRQQAAFFASYLERAKERILHRRLIVEMLRTTSQPEEPMRLSDCLSRVLPIANKCRIFEEREGLGNKRRQIAVWLMQEFSGLDKRQSLEGVGLLFFRPKRRDTWQPPQDLLAAPWNFTDNEIYDLLTLLLNTLRRQGAVSYLLSDEGIDLLSDCRDDFRPRTRPFYVRENNSESSYTHGIYSWLPAGHSNNSRLDFVKRLLKKKNPTLGDVELHEKSLELLRRLWTHLTGTSSTLFKWWLESVTINYRGAGGVVYRLSQDLWEIVPTLEMEHAPWQICTRCRNLTPINLNGVCPTYGCAGTLEPLDDHIAWVEDNMYRFQYQHSMLVPLIAQEHTAQWRPEKAAEVQKDFISGKINVLSCSTTFELGVDVGDLNAVVLRTMPPSTANYIQRAGRAGRRTDSIALVVTFAQRRPHDLTFYDQPERMISGKIRAPIVSLRNDKIIRRHLHSVVFADFFRWAKERVEYHNTGDFFANIDPAMRGPELLRNFLKGRPASLEASLFRIIPENVQLALGLKNWGWVAYLIDSDEAILDKTSTLIQEELQEFARLEREASQARKHHEAAQYEEIQNQIRSRKLFGYLGSHNVLPKYSFPTDVVSLQTEHLNIDGAKDIDLDRDLKVAISEFAPGGQVVAAKKIWYSCGIKKMPNKLWTPYAYAICKTCKRMTITPGEDRTPAICPSCQQAFTGVGQKGIFIIPEHGFIADKRTDKPGEQPPEHIYASHIYFSHYSSDPSVLSPKMDLELHPDPEFTWGMQVSKGYSQHAWLALVNKGYNDGFSVCTQCGHADVIPPGPKKRKVESHNNPLTQQPCKGTPKPYHLGHRFMTDVLEIRINASMPREEQVLSMLYALLNGASDALDIPREDVGGLVYYDDGAPSFILYDNTPGGSGYVQHIHDHLLKVFNAAYRRVSECNGCSAETSCYSCLRGYDNQNVHDKLERRLAWEILGRVLEKPLP